MKPVLILLPAALLAAGIGLAQRHQLSTLKREAAELTLRRGTSSPSPDKPGVRPRPRMAGPAPVGAFADRSVADLAALTVDMFEKNNTRRSNGRGGGPMTPEEKEDVKAFQNQLSEALGKLRAEEVLELIRRLEAIPHLPELLRKGPAQACVGILIGLNPEVLMDVIPALEDYPDASQEMLRVFQSWMRMSPADAVRWYDNEVGKGNPLVRSAGFFRSVAFGEVKSNPSHAITRMLSHEAGVDSELLANSGVAIVGGLSEVDDHSSFLFALHHQMERSPDSSVLADIHREYLNALGLDLSRWSFKNMAAMLDARCSPEEKAVIVRNVYRHKLDDPEGWATWIMAVTPLPGEEHPLKRYYGDWRQVDPGAAKSWLEQAPAGELKDELSARYLGKPE